MNAAALSTGRSMPASVLGFAAVCLLMTAAAAASLHLGEGAVEKGLARSLPAAVPQPLLGSTLRAATARVRCPICGVVESIRRIDATALAPASYELTVRLRDGSSRVSRDATAARWRVGDAIMLMGGERHF